MDISDAILDEFAQAIFEKIELIFAKQLNTANVEFAYSGIVKSVDGDNAIVDLGDYTTELIPNRTHETIAVGDTVKVFCDRLNMSGAYIGVRLHEYTSE